MLRLRVVLVRISASLLASSDTGCFSLIRYHHHFATMVSKGTNVTCCLEKLDLFVGAKYAGEHKHGLYFDFAFGLKFDGFSMSAGEPTDGNSNLGLPWRMRFDLTLFSIYIHFGYSCADLNLPEPSAPSVADVFHSPFEF
jgi:hypothetical protein